MSATRKRRGSATNFARSRTSDVAMPFSSWKELVHSRPLLSPARLRSPGQPNFSAGIVLRSDWSKGKLAVSAASEYHSFAGRK